MRSIKVIFANGDSLVTSINGTEDEIKSYYLGGVAPGSSVRKGNDFNIGRGEHDNVVRAVKVEFLD